MKAREGLSAAALTLLTLTAIDTRGQEEPAGDAVNAERAPNAGFDGLETATSLGRIRDTFIAAGDFQAALSPAEEVVELLEEHEPNELPRALGRLARIQAELDDFTAAELNYLKAIDLLIGEEGEFSISLLEPYQGLGRNYIKNRQFAEAVTVLEQAQHVSQRNLGLFNVSQTELIDDLTTAHLGMGDTLTAQRLQLDRLDNAVRRFGATSPQLVPFRYSLARYYDQSRMREAAREQYQEVVTLLETHAESDAETLLDPLRQIMKIELLLGDSDQARTKLLAMLESQPGIGSLERARSLVALGDWSIAKEDLPAARSYYAQAHEQLRGAADAEREATLAGPAMLDFIAPLSPVDRGTRSRRQYTWGSIVLEFDVSADGRASNVETVAATPPNFMDTAYNRRIRETHFRPRLVDGAPQATENVRFTHYFRYYVDN
jgi:tetratricopeptide (TPR) repeat protein